ncbi:hypothetical protein IB275_13525 [Pseudomonas sp. PDM21]|uniref:hypothetical protein n=1 Tax=Pseudomonas sp. PDM21 TaxID=2769257 RepID=UPI001782F77D|nr:hypothetical protein [Pseudomonas sp. PDM21]MBD9671597.1 hypothetical protein [Pseudomonas sp. PDM21]
MLSSADRAQLAAAIVATAETLGQTISSSAAEMMAHDLAEFPAEGIANALRACRRELTGKLTLASILQRIHAADGRPEPNEAWAIALESFDEASTVLMTPEIQQAAAAALPIFQAKDKVGARMAFIEAYAKLTTAARQLSQPAKWVISLGHDQQCRVTAIRDAERLGRLPAPEAALLLSQHTQEPISGDGQAIAGLITGNGVAPSPALREKWQQVKQVVEQGKRRQEIQRRWDARCERRKFAERKAQLIAAAEQLQAREVANG